MALKRMVRYIFGEQEWRGAGDFNFSAFQVSKMGLAQTSGVRVLFKFVNTCTPQLQLQSNSIQVTSLEFCAS